MTTASGPASKVEPLDRARRLCVETERRTTDIELGLGEAWVHRAEGRFAAARKLLPRLRKEVASLPHPPPHLLAEVDVLERKLLPREVERRPAASPRPILDGRRTALDRFHALREALRAKISARIGNLRRPSPAEHPVREDVLRILLDQVAVAQGLLASLDPGLVGRHGVEGVAEEFEDLRGVLRELLQEKAETP